MHRRSLLQGLLAFCGLGAVKGNYLTADLNGDGIVNNKDLAIMAEQWMMIENVRPPKKYSPVLHDMIPIPLQEPVAVAGYSTNVTPASLHGNVVLSEDTSFYDSYDRSWKMTITGAGDGSDRRRVEFVFDEPRTLDGVIDLNLACSDWSKLTVMWIKLYSSEYPGGFFRKILINGGNATYGKVFGWNNNEFRPIQVTPVSPNAPQGASLQASGEDWTHEHLFSGFEIELGAAEGDTVDFWLDSAVIQKWRDKSGNKIESMVVDLDHGRVPTQNKVFWPLANRGYGNMFVSGLQVDGQSDYPSFDDLRAIQAAGGQVGPHMRIPDPFSNWQDSPDAETTSNSLRTLLRQFEDEGCNNPGLSNFIFLQNRGDFVEYNNLNENAYHEDNISSGRVLHENGIVCTRGSVIDPYFRTDFSGDSGSGTFASTPISNSNWIPPHGRYNYSGSGLHFKTGEWNESVLPEIITFKGFGIPWFTYIHNVTPTATSGNISEAWAEALVNYILTNDVLMLTRLDLYNLTYGRFGEWHVDVTNNKWVSRFDSTKRLIEEQYPLTP